MKAEERHELEQNLLASLLAKAAEYLLKYGKYLLAIGAAAAVLWLGLWYWSVSSRNRQSEAWDKFFAAANADQYADLLKQYPNTTPAAYAELRLADALYLEARRQLVSERSAALANLEDARGRYEHLTKGSGIPADVRRQAALGLALAWEADGRQKARDTAKRLYEELQATYRNDMEGQVAERRLKELSTPEAAEFYSRLVNYDPSKTSTALPDPTKDELPSLPSLPARPSGVPPKGQPTPVEKGFGSEPVPPPPKLPPKAAAKPAEKPAEKK